MGAYKSLCKLLFGGCFGFVFLVFWVFFWLKTKCTTHNQQKENSTTKKSFKIIQFIFPSRLRIIKSKKPSDETPIKFKQVTSKTMKRRIIMRILFVCYGNAYRSPLAEALLKKSRPDLEVDSAGLKTSIPIGTLIKEFLNNNSAIQYLKKTPQSIDQKDLKNYDLIVTMQNIHTKVILKKCPECEKKIIEWDIEDPYFLDKKSAKKILQYIKKEVEKLSKTL